MTCPICYEDMDMREYQDEQQSTQTCFKLDCGHAYHTSCIIGFLTQTESKCPCCNNQKTVKKELTREATIKKLCQEVRNSERVKQCKEEFIEAQKEYKIVLKQLKNETTVWIRQRVQELNLSTIRSYFLQCIKACKTELWKVARLKGASHVGALQSLVDQSYHRRNRYPRPGQMSVPTLLFNTNERRDTYRLSYPRFYLSYLNLMKKK